MEHPAIPIPAYQPVRVFWGNHSYAVEIGTTPMNMVLSFIHDWFAENDHYFHLDKFPPYQRLWGDEKCVLIDYGSYNHYVYCIPTK